MKNKIAVRRAVEADCPQLAKLLSGLQAHYRSADPPGGAARMASLLARAGDRQPFALVAELDGQLVGVATLSPVLYGGAFEWLLDLKDLYVSTRSQGVGRELMRAIAQVARDGGYVRVDWTTDAGNEGAQRFYDGLGIPRQPKVNYRLTGANLARLASL
jgi:GNAT superfamily N-acetyltransferase